MFQRRSQRQAAAPPARCARSDWIAADSSIGHSTTRRTAATTPVAAAELLRARIREELGLAYSVYTYSSSYQGLGSFCVYAGTTPDNAPTVLSELQSQLDLLLRDGLTDKEFRSAKAQLRGGFLLGLESSGGRMQALGRGHLLLGRVRTPEETLARIEAVTPDAVMDLARRLLGQKGSAAIVGRGAEALLARIGG